MKIALFRGPNYDKPVVGDEITEKWCTDYIRVTEYVDVEFPPLSTADKQAIESRLQAARESARAYYDKQLARIDDQARALPL